jgi:hypothetical protein
MYFRLEVTVLPLPFFSSTWQHGRRKLLEFDFFTPRRDRCLLASSCFFTPRRSQLLEFDFFTPRRDRCLLFFYTETRSPSACRGRNRSNTAFPFSEETDVASPPALSPRRRVVLVGLGGGPTPSRRMRPAHRGDGRR